MSDPVQNKTPEKYRVDRLPREEMIQSLLSRTGRQWYLGGKYLWVWNVKIHEYVSSWDDIEEELKQYICGYIGSDWWEDAEFRERAKQLVNKAVDRNDVDISYQVYEDMQRMVSDEDTYRMLWSGRDMSPDWVFEGRSAGWLCLKGLFGSSFRMWESYEYRDWLEELEEDDLFDVYRFLHQCDADFEDENLGAIFRDTYAYNVSQYVGLDELTDWFLAKRAELVNGDGI